MRHSAAAFIFSIACLSVLAGERPNIIIILTDDMGYSDAGCFGGEIQTPNIDSLAAGGLRMTEFYNAARCWPTRATLLSGRYAESIGTGQTTIASVLKSAGYGTGMVGKWHLSRSPRENGPIQRGFDSFYGTINGVGSFFAPPTLTRNTEYIEPDSDNYYYTERIGEEAVFQIEEFSKSERPFFQYVAFTAPHWPLHAPEETVQKYLSTYRGGWEKIRHNRYARMIEMGIIDEETCKLPDMEPDVPRWDDVDHKEWRIRNMAVYAAMIDSMDHSIGQIIDALKRTRQFENTLIIYFNDNGACHEILDPEAFREDLGEGMVIGNVYDVAMGGPNTWGSIGPNWANAQNTPLRRYKNNTHQGGICTSAIMHWPDGLKHKSGAITRQRGHVVDMLATCIELAGAEYPLEVGGHRILAHDGISLVPIISGHEVSRDHTYYFDRGLKSQALISGDYKIVRDGDTPWELYKLSNDFSETKDISAQNPKLVSLLAKRWENKKWIHPRPKDYNFTIFPPQDN